MNANDKSKQLKTIKERVETYRKIVEEQILRTGKYIISESLKASSQRKAEDYSSVIEDMKKVASALESYKKILDAGEAPDEQKLDELIDKCEQTIRDANKIGQPNLGHTYRGIANDIRAISKSLASA